MPVSVSAGLAFASLLLIISSLSSLTFVNSSPFQSVVQQSDASQRTDIGGRGNPGRFGDVRTYISSERSTRTEEATSSRVQPESQPTATPSNASTTTDGCPNCLKKTSYSKSRPASDTNEIGEEEDARNELQKLRIEEIKRKILKKLRMSNRPSVTIPRSMLPEPLKGGELDFFPQMDEHPSSQADDDYYGTTEKVIVIAENVDYPVCNTQHHDPAGCFNFKLAKNVLNREVSSAELWVYKLRDKRDKHNQTYIVSELPNANYSISMRHSTVSITEVSIKNGWIKFDLTPTVRRWLQKSRANVQGLKISCKTCAMDVDDSPVSNDPGEKPFIVIHFTSQEVQRRGKRNLDCQPNSTFCCKDSLYVNFSNIGWDDWIISPQGYYANYCRGTCMEEITSSASHHATVIQQYLLRNKSSLSKSQVNQLVPCCTATKITPISIIYTTEKDATNLICNSLPNMAVESCGCK